MTAAGSSIQTSGGPPPPGSGSGGASTRDRAADLIFLAALLLGLVRFFRLGEWSLWFDEASTWGDWRSGLEGGEISNPIGYRAIALVVKLLGGVPDEFALRFLPALGGFVAIVFTSWAFKPFAGPRRAAAAALLVAASSWHVYWSQSARFYTLAQLFSLLGTGIALRGLWRPRIALALVGFAIAAFAAALQPSAGLVLPALVLAPFATRLVVRQGVRPDWRPAATMLGLAALFLAVRYGWIRTAYENFARQKPASDPGHFVLTTGFYVTPLLCAACLVGSVVAWIRRDAFHLFVLFTIVLVLLGALAMSTMVRVSAQYVFVILPWFAILACVPIAPGAAPIAPGAAPIDRNGARDAGWLALLVLPALATLVLYFTARKGERPQWREAFEFVWDAHEEGDLILGMEATAGEHYLAPLRTDLRNTAHVAWLDRFRAKEPQRWARHSRRTWYVFNPEQLLDWDSQDRADFQRFLSEECRLVRCWPLYVESRDLSVWVYVR